MDDEITTHILNALEALNSNVENLCNAVATIGEMQTASTTRIEQMDTSHSKILELVESIKEQATPLLEKLSNSPVLKMLGV